MYNVFVHSFIFLEILETSICRFWKRWVPGNAEYWLNKVSQIKDMRSISSKEHEMVIGTSYKLFYFQVIEPLALAPLNIPTPTLHPIGMVR